MLSHVPLASIIITSYNYAAYLAQAIDSALAQTYPHVEVIVVDDGSRDSSREIIANYGNRIGSLLKANGGQASAWNVGFKLSHGDVICFLDSDDALLPTAMEKAVYGFRAAEVLKVHWPLLEIDEHGTQTGNVIPRAGLPEGNLRELVLRDGPDSLVLPPTSGNAWRRSFLQGVLPIPEPAYRLCADSYLLALSAASGPIGRVDEPQGLYRVHGQNHSLGDSFEDMLKLELETFDTQCLTLSRFLPAADRVGAIACWAASSWRHRLRQALQEIDAQIPPANQFILVDDDRWGTRELMLGRRRIPFLDHDGQYWGAPSDDATAISELERQRTVGAHWIVFAWTCFWWLECYSEFARYLRAHYRSVLCNDRLIVFDLRGQSVEDGVIG
jgi:Glycosyl transferase family 2